MSYALRKRRIVALIAAYVVALQALLLPLAVVAGTPDPGLCASATSANQQQHSGGHANGCPCAAGCGMQCCAGILAGPSQAATVAMPADASPLAPAAAPAVLAQSRLHGPQLARAPPPA
jgi:hypothetical protein